MKRKPIYEFITSLMMVETALLIGIRESDNFRRVVAITLIIALKQIFDHLTYSAKKTSEQDSKISECDYNKRIEELSNDFNNDDYLDSIVNDELSDL